MKKKILLGIIIIAAVILAIYGVLLVKRQINIKNENNEIKKDSKVLVAYFSAQGHTDYVAKEIAKNLSADLFLIEPKEEYTSEDLNYNNSSSRVSKEHKDESLRNIELVTSKIENIDEYDTILIGYPIWWGIAAWPVNTFVKSNDFTNKTIIPFCTSASSSLGKSGELLSELAGTGNWLDGHRFSSNVSASEIKEWTDKIKGGNNE